MNITFVIGGARCGKSSFALNEASKIEGRKAYIATAEPLDDEMRERIEKHRVERGKEWATYEEPLELSDILSRIKDTYQVAVIDCLTIWLANLLARAEIPVPGEKTADEAVEEFMEALKGCADLNLMIVSNEVGMGIVPNNKLSRKFRDLAGTLNQGVAAAADSVYLVAAGLPLKIK